MTILVTGAAGFIGFHVARALLARGETVVGIDNLSPYYSVALKEARLAQLASLPAFSFHRADVADRDRVFEIVETTPELRGIVHLAAQAGVRYSLENPFTYVEANVMGQVVMLEAARRVPGLRHFVYASSSSVYGGNTKLPFSTDDPVDHPVSVYAASKRAGELMAESYAHLYGLPCTGLRFFTVYGPWGRPDMAAYLFADAIVHDTPIKVFNQGLMGRDFTYIDDIAAGTIAALDRAPRAGSGPPHRIFNLGNSKPQKLTAFIRAIEAALGKTARQELLPMQAGDVPSTYADIESSRRELGFEPTTPIEIGIPRFVAWYKQYHRAE